MCNGNPAPACSPSSVQTANTLSFHPSSQPCQEFDNTPPAGFERSKRMALCPGWTSSNITYSIFCPDAESVMRHFASKRVPSPLHLGPHDHLILRWLNMRSKKSRMALGMVRGCSTGVCWPFAKGSYLDSFLVSAHSVNRNAMTTTPIYSAEGNGYS